MNNTNKEAPIFAKCRRGSDLATNGQSCSSTSAVKMSPDGSASPTFKCKKCGYIWSISVGGSFNV